MNTDMIIQQAKQRKRDYIRAREPIIQQLVNLEVFAVRRVMSINPDGSFELETILSEEGQRMKDELLAMLALIQREVL